MEGTCEPLLIVGGSLDSFGLVYVLLRSMKISTIWRLAQYIKKCGTRIVEYYFKIYVPLNVHKLKKLSR
jgi:hypothetical protein